MATQYGAQGSGWGGIHKKERYHLTFWVVFFFFFGREGTGIGTGRDGNGIYGLAKKRTCARDFFFGFDRQAFNNHRMHGERERVCVREKKKLQVALLVFLFVGGFFFWTFGFGWENWKGGWVGLGERVGMEWAWDGI